MVAKKVEMTVGLMDDYLVVMKAEQLVESMVVRKAVMMAVLTAATMDKMMVAMMAVLMAGNSVIHSADSKAECLVAKMDH